MKTSIQFLRPLAQRTVPIFAFSMRALPRTTRYPFQPSVAAFSIIGDAISGFANKRVEATKEQQFEKMMSTMVKEPKWTFRVWKTVLEDQLNSWMMYIPGMSSSKDVQDLKGLKAIIDSMNDQELDHPEHVNGRTKERIAAASGKSIDQVRSLIFLHKQTSIVHRWIHLKKANNEPLPKNNHELTKLLEDDNRARSLAMKVFHGDDKPKRSGRGKRSYV